MSNIKVQCIDQAIGFLNTPVISSGNVNYDTITFDFCSKWDGFAKTAIFYRTKDEVYYGILDETNSCIIPREVLTEKGTFYIGVFGSKDDVTITSAVLAYKVQEGAITENTKPSDPTPDIYDQLIAKYAEYNSKLDSQVKRMDDLEDRLDTGVGDAEKLGGQLPSYYASAQSVTDIVNGTTKVSKASTADSAGDSSKLGGKGASEYMLLSNKDLRQAKTYSDIFSSTLTSTHECWNKWCYVVGSGIANAPETGDVWYEVFTGGIDNRAFQIAIGCFFHQRSVHIRYKHDATWYSWRKIATDTDLANYQNKDDVRDLETLFSSITTPTDIRAIMYNLPSGHYTCATTTYPNVTFPFADGVGTQIEWERLKHANGYYYGTLTITSMVDNSQWATCSVYNNTSYTEWISFLPLTGGKIPGFLSGKGIISAYSAFQEIALHASDVETSGSGLYSITFSKWLVNCLSDGKVDYAEGTMNGKTIHHSGNSSPVVPVNVDPGVGASVTYADGTVLFVYEEE